MQVCGLLDYGYCDQGNWFLRYGIGGSTNDPKSNLSSVPEFNLILQGKVSVWEHVLPMNMVKPLQRFKKLVRDAINSMKLKNKFQQK